MKPTLVLLPGMDGTGELLEPLAEAIGGRLACAIIRYPSTGAQTYQALTSYVRNQLPDGPICILGESFSGPVAIELAASHAPVVGLILAATFARSPFPRFLTQVAFTADLLPAVAARWFLLNSIRKSGVANRLSRVLDGLPPGVLSKRAAAALQMDVRTKLDGIKCRRLVISAIRDRVVSFAHTRELLSGKGECVHVGIEAPHMVLQTNTAEVAEAIVAFCLE